MVPALGVVLSAGLRVLSAGLEEFRGALGKTWRSEFLKFLESHWPVVLGYFVSIMGYMWPVALGYLAFHFVTMEVSILPICSSDALE